MVATTIDPGGHILATINGDGEATGAVAFDDVNGSSYVTVVDTDPSTGQASTSVWGLTLAGATKLNTVGGTPASGGQAGSTATLSLTQHGDVFCVDVQHGRNRCTDHQCQCLAGRLATAESISRQKNWIDPSNGVTTVNITFTPTSAGQGTPSYTGSTTSLLGDVQVNSDGTVVFTPSAAGRQLAAQSDRTTYASFVVTATDGEGHQTFIPMTVLLRPADYPTQGQASSAHSRLKLEDISCRRRASEQPVRRRTRPRSD